PEGWDGTPFDNPAIENYTDAEIWEIHVRDFSNKIASSQYKGKYLAFTETGLTNSNGVPVGIDYLKQLGITHVHLLPSYDYASVDESKTNQFNWGYDPQNYNVPEGSYSTDPYDGAVRVNEYKQMVQALHDAGISVVMDVVYNHTYGIDSNLNKVVPYYYYRYSYDGVPSNGSGCGNETASERVMMRKYIVDSVKYWQSEYNLDGFRFDLMGLHDVTTMQAVEEAVHAVNPEALIYGEGWQGGTSTLPTSSACTLSNLKKLNTNKQTNGVAMFNDVLRDAVKGSVFDIEDTGFATGAKAAYLGKVLFGVQGSVNNPAFYGSGVSVSWSAYNPTNVINYVSAHDNNTLWDRICKVYGQQESTLDERIKMNNLSAAIVQTSLGIPFMQAGEEILRTKTNPDGSFNENSYNSPDSVNNIDWEKLTSTSSQYEVMQYYKGLIAFRKSCETLRMATAVDAENNPVCEIVEKQGAFVAFTITNPETGEKLLVIYNANTTESTFTLPTGSWNLYIN
ncbi:MAG: type I pullulanase, partial [Candidatus Coproplasma sp.]